MRSGNILAYVIRFYRFVSLYSRVTYFQSRLQSLPLHEAIDLKKVICAPLRYTIKYQRMTAEVMPVKTLTYETLNNVPSRQI